MTVFLLSYSASCGLMLLLLLLLSSSNALRWSGAGKLLRPIGAIVVTTSLTFQLPLPSLLSHFPPSSSIAVADSTGKMSSKMTARKRYLPRVFSGVSKFLKLRTLAEVRDFQTNDLPSFKRAMSLYGASLRKGEIPDEISREAEERTNAFEKAVLKIAVKGNGKEDEAVASELLAPSRSALESFLSFAKLPSLDSADYSSPVK